MTKEARIYNGEKTVSSISGTRSSHRGTAETNPTRNHEVVGSIPGLNQWVKDPVLLWLWYMPAAIAPIQPLAWEPPHAMDADLKKEPKNKIKLGKKKVVMGKLDSYMEKNEIITFSNTISKNKLKREDLNERLKTGYYKIPRGKDRHKTL